MEEVKLTKRELEVSTLLAYGNMQKTVAAKLGLSIKTIQVISTSAYRKMRVHSSIAAAKWLIENKYIDASHWTVKDSPESDHNQT